MRDDDLAGLIKEYNNWLREGNHADMELYGISTEEARDTLDSFVGEHKSIVYACLKHSKASEFGGLAVTGNHLFFYFLNVFRVKWEAAGLLILPFDAVTNIKISRFLIWNNLQISFKGDDGKERKLKYQISSVVAGLKKQRVNVRALLRHLRERVF